MMERLLRDARADGRVVAGLRASEAVIYGRFGFGVAAEAADVVVRAKRARPVHAPAAGSIRLLEPSEIMDVVPDLYDRVARHRTGTIARPHWLIRRYFEDAIETTKSSHVAVHADPTGRLDGYAHYTVRWDEGEGDAEGMGRGELHDLFAADATVERALWAYLADVDLVDEWRAEERPFDDSIRFALRDSRAYRVRQFWDEQWLRLLDVDAALQARTYGAARGSAVVQVHDPWFDENRGRWRIDAQGAICTDDDPDLDVGIDVLSAAYLGGTSWRTLADAGRVTVHRPEALAAADTLFAERPVPFCGSFY
jgi:predicted acetyltransferase